MSRRIGFMVGLLAAVGLGGGLVASGKVRLASRQPLFHLEKARVERGDLVGRVTATGAPSALGNLEQARAAYNQAKVNLGYTTIVSPINGVVISRNVDVGQTVAASLQAPTLFTIAEDLGKMQVHAAVSEADVGRLSAGLSA